mgnify:CR=1 FL=1
MHRQLGGCALTDHRSWRNVFAGKTYPERICGDQAGNWRMFTTKNHAGAVSDTAVRRRSDLYDPWRRHVFSEVTPGTAAAFGGVTDGLQQFGIPVACCSDGPSGIRMDCGTMPMHCRTVRCWHVPLIRSWWKNCMRWRAWSFGRTRSTPS